MDNFELKISKSDWLYINLLGGIFGLLLGIFLFFIEPKFHFFSVPFFGFCTGVAISLFSAFFISVSNNYILPMIEKKYWYIISFGFSFYSGALGFLFSYSVFFLLKTPVAYLIEPYSIYLTLIVGCLTFFVGLILHQFTAMKYKNEAIKNEILESKIKALENELNPHFLFNALNSMSELVYLDPKKAEESILNLSQFLRNAIKTDSIISVENELNMVKNYVSIENIRFENQIVLDIKKNNHTKYIMIPKFSIQLLVENAIKHGFDNKKLHIQIVVDDDIIVSNDGKKVDNLTFGTGLNNLDKRLRFFKIGYLEYVNDENMRFIIKVEK